MGNKTHKNHLLRALMEDNDSIAVYFTENIAQEDAGRISFFKGEKICDFNIYNLFNTKLVIKTPPMNIKDLYYIGFDKERIPVIPFGVLDKNEFFYEGNDLGLTYSKEKSTFKLWAPTAHSININIYDDLRSGVSKKYQLSEKENGIWEVVLTGDFKGKFYNFNVSGSLPEFDETRNVLDPYAKCVIADTGRCMITDTSDYPDKTPLKDRFNINKSIIYEIHVRDISIDNSSGVKNNGKYLALTEDDTWLNGDKNSGIKTVKSHLKELGINTVQIMPIQDFENDEKDPNHYNWGYMPRFFNTPDGSYASDWRNDSKIRETKEMVNSLHKDGFRVILDVVYNHTSEGFNGNGIYSFNGLVPFFYYRFGNGYISNGSGCGNELRTESRMVRKFIVDSLKYWMDFYGFDGFRFDLMGLIDLQTMETIIDELRSVSPDVLVYGEPWTGGLTPIQPTYKGMQKNKGFFVFNDEYRDAIKGAVFNKKEKGFVQMAGHHNYDKIIQGILGSINTFAASPIESLNYVEVHDNNTLFDKLYFTITGNENFSEPSHDVELRIELMHRLCNFLILTSQGIPVLHLGQDFMRTKFGVENSYNSGDNINKIDWNRKSRFNKTFNYYKNIIEFRKTHPLLTLTSESGLRDAIEFRRDIIDSHYEFCLAYMLEHYNLDSNITEKLLILINPYDKPIKVDIKEDGFKKILFGLDYFRDSFPDIDRHFEIPQTSGCILIKI